MTLVAPPPYTLAVATTLADLADCICEELSTSGAGPPCWCGLYPGQSVSWEFCGECDNDRCGMGYVRLAGVFPYSVFPEQTIDTRCTYPLGWAVEVGALRCLPQPSDGTLPSPQEMAEVAIRQVLDASAIHRGLKCCDHEVAVQQYVPVGPSGGCVGGFWLGYLAVD
jgi:hypothetical protein